jgi:orotate phosphoribosyltransferase
MDSERSRLLEILKRTSYLESDTESFHLASGIDSKYYVDCKQALSYPNARSYLANLIFELVKDEPIDAIGGLEIGAYPIATSVSDKFFRESGRVLRAFVVRKDRKKHGIKTLLAGDVHAGDHVVIVDDVITSGSSAIQAIDSVREAGLTVERVVAMVDREESDGRINIEKKGVKFDALFTLKDLVEFRGPIAEGNDRSANQERIVRKQSARDAAAG